LLIEMTPDELRQRTKEFALRCLKAAESLPRSITGRTIAGQMARSATSVAANYRAACRARSRADFVSKIAVVQEEADETAFWLELAVEAGALRGSKVRPLAVEAGELVAIFAASHISAARKVPRP
jgi:four helix bundle protein